MASPSPVGMTWSACGPCDLDDLLLMGRKVLGESATPDTLRRPATGSSTGAGLRGPSFGPPIGPPVGLPVDGKYRCRRAPAQRPWTEGQLLQTLR